MYDSEKSFTSLSDTILKLPATSNVSEYDAKNGNVMNVIKNSLTHENIDKVKVKIKYLFLKIRLYYIKSLVREKVDKMKYLVDKNDILSEISNLKKESHIISKMLKEVII